MAEMTEVRIDKWLWAARFFKTRSLAAKAVGGGHVTLNGGRVKPAKTVRTGDELLIRQGSSEITVRVLDLSDRRGSAEMARTLYGETEESSFRREKERLERAASPFQARPDHRPDKHERREIRRFLKKE